MSQRMNVTLLGHKDHGKSTLIGRLLYDSGSVMEDRVEEVKKSSKALGLPFEYAFLLDSFEEERAGGMTIDVIHAQIKGKRYLYDCIDVPGHRELVKNMLTGASHADAGILIVSAKEGIEEQTGHHLRLAQWLGIEQLIVVVNKMDLVDYQEGTFHKIRDGVSNLMSLGSIGSISFIPISAYGGDNIIKGSSKMSWYRGPSLLDCMENLVLRDQLSKRSFRFPVQDLYREDNDQLIIAGRVESGTIRPNQDIVFLPSGTTAKVEAIQTFDGKIDSAKAGENIGLICEPVPEKAKRGDVCCFPDDLVHVKNEVRAHAIFLYEISDRVSVECGTAVSDCQIENRASMEIGDVVEVMLRFKEPMVVERSMTSIGRLAIKQKGRIVGVAVVL